MGAESASASRPVLSVSELLRSVRDTLERRFPLLWVGGEISNLKTAPSGHCYFTLKDDAAQVDCVMFRSRLSALDWQPAEGMRVEARALVSLYEPRGRFQLTVEGMRRAGDGPLYERFLKLKARLEAEGLFDPAAKRELPEHPRRIGILTSLAAAALHDVLTCLARRNPSIPVIVYPVPVQGEGAARRIAAMLATANERAECDVLLLVRGGGSIEDLWQFNEEVVARALRASAIPVVVGVGHETDLTIADFAADRRAPTPTAAAELVSPSQAALIVQLADLSKKLSRETSRSLGYAIQAVDALARRLVHPRERLRSSTELLRQLTGRLTFSLKKELENWRGQVEHFRAVVASLDPTAVLARGYSLTRNAQGEVVRDASRLSEGEVINTTFAKGSVESEVRKRTK